MSTGTSISGSDRSDFQNQRGPARSASAPLTRGRFNEEHDCLRLMFIQFSINPQNNEKSTSRLSLRTTKTTVKRRGTTRFSSTKQQSYSRY